MLSNVISFVSSVESKSILEIFICDIAFCCSFIMVRVVRLSFLWLLHVPTWILKIEYVITVSSLLVNSSISLCWWSFHHRLLLHIHIVKENSPFPGQMLKKLSLLLLRIPLARSYLWFAQSNWFSVLVFL